jgi:dolichyl-phosphate-mannose--protein O-mannosyl transferase
MRRLFALPADFDRSFSWLAAALVAVMGLAQFTSALRESPVWDENYDIAAACTYLRTGDYSLNSDHPALGKLLNGLPLLAWDLELPPRETVWTADKAIKAGRKFVFENRVPAEKIVICSRSVSIVFTLAVGCVLALWARRRFGSSVALLALCFYAFDPNLIAHGRYVTSDPYIAGFSWLACIAWGEYLDDRTWRKLLLSGAMLGCALGSKTSALVLPAILLLLHLLHGISVSPRSAFGTRLRRLVLDNAAC